MSSAPDREENGSSSDAEGGEEEYDGSFNNARRDLGEQLAHIVADSGEIPLRYAYGGTKEL